MQDMMSGSAGDSGGDDVDRKGSKRELSQSKRAAQNRAAQVSHCRNSLCHLSSRVFTSSVSCRVVW